MNSTRLPLDFPPLSELATRAAIEHSAAFAAACVYPGAADWGSIDEHSRRVRTAAFASLLSDLTRPESQAVWLRWLAARLGVPVPVVGAPTWRYVPEFAMAVLNDGGRDVVVFLFGDVRPPGCMRHVMTGGAGSAIHGINAPTLDNPDSTDAPIRALVLAILTVGAK